MDYSKCEIILFDTAFNSFSYSCGKYEADFELSYEYNNFFDAFNRIKEEGLSREEIAYMIEIQSDIADKQETVVWLNKHISELGKEKQELEKDIIWLREIKMNLER